MSATRAQLEAALRRAENAGDINTAEAIAVDLSVFIDADVAEIEKRDGYLVPDWSFDQ